MIEEMLDQPAFREKGRYHSPPPLIIIQWPQHNMLPPCTLHITHNMLRLHLLIILFLTSSSRDQLRSICGLPLSTYFSATKLRWLIQNVPEVCMTKTIST